MCVIEGKHTGEYERDAKDAKPAIQIAEEIIEFIQREIKTCISSRSKKSLVRNNNAVYTAPSV